MERFPTLALGGLNLTPTRMAGGIPTTALDQYAATAGNVVWSRRGEPAVHFPEHWLNFNERQSGVPAATPRHFIFTLR